MTSIAVIFILSLIGYNVTDKGHGQLDERLLSSISVGGSELCNILYTVGDSKTYSKFTLGTRIHCIAIRSCN